MSKIKLPKSKTKPVEPEPVAALSEPTVEPPEEEEVTDVPVIDLVLTGLASHLEILGAARRKLSSRPIAPFEIAAVYS